MYCNKLQKKLRKVTFNICAYTSIKYGSHIQYITQATNTLKT